MEAGGSHRDGIRQTISDQELADLAKGFGIASVAGALSI
jgi:hypothetical protein